MHVLTAKQIREEERDTVEMYDLLAPSSFIGDTSTVLTKREDVFSVLRYRGVDPECLDPETIADACEHFHGVVRGIDTQYRIYQYVIKRDRPALPACDSVDPLAQARSRWLESRRSDLYSIELYGALLRMASRQESLSSKLFGTLSINEAAQDAQQRLRRRCRALQAVARGAVVRLEQLFQPEILDRRGTLRFLLKLTNAMEVDCDIYGSIPKCRLDEYISRTRLRCFPRHLQQGKRFIKILTLDKIPSVPEAHFRALLAVPCSMIICSEWQRIENEVVRREIEKHRVHHQWNKSNWFVGAFKKQPRADEVLIDESKVDVLKVLSRAIKEIEVKNNFFGRYAMTIALQHEDEAELEDRASMVRQVAMRYDAQLIEETSNLHNAWLSMIPGNYLHTARPRWLLNVPYANSSFLFAPSEGNRWNEHLGKPCLNLLETSDGTLHGYNVHVGEVGNAASFGSVGSGKSFGMNSDVAGLQQYDPFTAIFDRGGSYRALTKHYGGSYLHVGESSDFTINPFCLPPTPGNLNFLVAFVKLLIEQTGEPLTAVEEEDLFERIKSMYACDPSEHRLSYIAETAAKTYNMRLNNWVRDGHLACYFDNPVDNLTLSNFQCFEFMKMSNPQVLEAMFFYVLQRISSVVYDRSQRSRLKVIVFDEAHEFLKHEKTRSFIHRALKEFRKENAIVLLATQSASDLIASGLTDTVIEQCMTKKFYPSPGADENVYRDLFKLTRTEAGLISKLNIGEFLLHQTHGSTVLRLNVDPYSFQIFSNKENK